MTKEFTIGADSKSTLEKAMNRLNRHAKKHGYSECVIISVSKPYETIRRIYDSGAQTQDDYIKSVVIVCDVVVDIPEQFLNPTSAEWNVIGRVVNAEGMPEVSGTDIKKIAKASDGFDWKCATCSHKLGKAFVIEHKDGRVLIVGQECLKQYTGVDGIAVIAAIEFINAITLKDELEDCDGSGGGGREILNVIDLEDFLTMAVAVAEYKGGYLRRWEVNEYGDKRENADCTRNITLTNMLGKPLTINGEPMIVDGKAVCAMASYIFPIIKSTEAHRERAKQLIAAWTNPPYIPVQQITSYDNTVMSVPSEYVLQCQFLAERGWISEKTAGIAASMVNEPPQKPKDYSGSVHVGNIGDRSNFDLTVINIFESHHGTYGPSTVIKMADSNDNVFVWFATGIKNYRKGNVVTIKGTIKAHDEYKGVKQTVLTRCKIA